MFPRFSLLFLLFSSSCCFLFSSLALDTAIYSSRERDASAAALAAWALEARGATTTTPPPTTTTTTPPALPSNNTSSPPPVSSLSTPPTPLPVLLGRYDPCSEPGPATKGRALYLGLALWPGAAPEAWGPSSSASKSRKGSGGGGSGGDSSLAADDFDDASLNPCRLSARSDPRDGSALPSAAATLAAAGVLIAPFAVRIDSVAALRVGGALQRRALELAAAGVVLGKGPDASYPPPIVDHAQARAKTLLRYSVVKKPGLGSETAAD